jgi:murein DD-endopeptidase MepM/ murein hydrolase activator NlpD
LTPGVESGVTNAYNHEYIESYAIAGDVLVADSDGYLIKVNPQTAESNRIGMNDFAIHTVESGEVLSSIAEKYGVKVQTIMWENNMSNANSLRTGQKLLIPPVNGISYSVQSGDTIDKIAKKYEVTPEAIIAQNSLGDTSLSRGQNIFLPGAEPIYVAPVAPVVASRSNTAARSTGVSEIRTVDAPASSAAPTVGKVFIFPTRGSITQGYHSGHYALDIADRSKPPIWASGAGTVVKSSVGTWGGGYGNHVIIDHGNGLKTLYAHMDTVGVNVGDTVGQGDVIGIMGNTGRVYGVTGIHLHWEVWQDGVKQRPGNYY